MSAKIVKFIKVRMEAEDDSKDYEEIIFGQDIGIKIVSPKGVETMEDEMTQAIVTQMNSMMGVMASQIQRKGVDDGGS